MSDDPIVTEVRNTGNKIAENCGNDIKRFSDMLRNKEKEMEKQGWKFVSKKDL